MAAAAPKGKSRLAHYLEQHAQALLASLGRLRRAPLPSTMTAAVIAISLALPAAFLLFLANAAQVTGAWEGGARISLFVHRDVPVARYQALAQELRAEPEVRATKVIGPEEGLAEFRALSGFDEALALLEDNPLPPVIEVEPAAGLAPAAVDGLAQRLGGRGEIETVRLDRQWIERLQGVMTLIERLVWVVAGLLAAVVVLVIGNTIRLDIENRREEIVVVKLIGGTDAFIRRPFLYEGLWYGLVGGMAAAVLVELGRWLLDAPAHELALLYGSAFSLQGLGLQGMLALLAAGVALGLAGSQLALGKHLASIEPR